MKKILTSLISALCAVAAQGAPEMKDSMPHQDLDTLTVTAPRHNAAGRYVWVPDTLVREVNDVLGGRRCLRTAILADMTEACTTTCLFPRTAGNSASPQATASSLPRTSSCWIWSATWTWT